MTGHVFIAPGDITQLSADAIAFSSSNALAGNGNLYSSFVANVPGFAGWYRQLGREAKGPLAVGATFWHALPGPGKPQGVVVVVSTGGGPPGDEDKAGLAVRGAIARAVRELRQAGRTGRLLVALPAFRVGMGGDRRQRLRSARAQLRAAGECLGEHADVDIAFLTYTQSLYRIFLEARRETAGPGGGDVLSYPELVRALRDGTAVLFVGAGLSSGAGLPGWDQLIGRLRAELGVAAAAEVDHLDLAQWYRERFGKQRLAELLGETFGGAGRPTLAHYLLLAPPVRHVITTNYDHLLEQTLTALKRHPLPVVTQEDVVHTGGDGVYVVKLHGDAGRPEKIVLSRDDYHTFFEDRPAMALLLEGLLLNRTFFFVGYSLRDPNFQLLFSRIARMLSRARRPAFATSFEARENVADYMRQQWHHQGLELISVPGATPDEQKLHFVRFLDRLAEEATLQAPPLVLAADVPPPQGLDRLRRLLQQAGEEVEALGRAGVGEKEAVFLAEVLRFLTAHGWRPHGAAGLSQLWEELARQAPPGERRPMLVAALQGAEAFADVERVRKGLG
jgi:hypothetical protein